jgi:hypothetical protein
VLRAEIDTRFAELHAEWRPYLYRWLDDAETRSPEEQLIAAATIRAISLRYVGRSFPQPRGSGCEAHPI